MRSARQVLALTALLSICVTVTFSYTLRNREPWSDENQQLEEALKVIQERRRMIDDEPIGYGGLGFDEEEEEDPWEREEPPRGYMDPDTMEYIRDMIYGTEDAVGSNRLMEEIAPLVERPSASNVDMNELSDIMKDEDEEDEDREDDKRVPTDMHKKEYDPSSIPAKKDMSGGAMESDKRTQDEIKEIMEDEAEDALNEAMEREEERGETGKADGRETVSNQELEDVLGGDDENELFPDMIAKEVSINKESFGDSLPGSYVSVKRKRSDYIPSIGEEEVALAEEQLAGQADSDDGELDDNDSDSAREYIKEFLALEDDENTNLANALNLATLAQVKKSDRYIIEEADYIKKAIEDEQAIQMLKSELAEDAEKDEDTKRSDPVTVQRVYEESNNIEPESALADEEKEALHDYMKTKLRQYLVRTSGALAMQNDIPEYSEDSIGKWFNAPVSADEEGISEQDATLNPFIRDLMEKIYSGNLAKRAPPITEEFRPQIEFEDDEPEDEDDVDDATKAEIATVLQAYVEDMTPTQRLVLKEAVREKLEELEEEEDMQNEIEEEGYCPALEFLDDCEAAREAGLHLDMEALYMCNRHQMCYTCGSSHGFEASQCDKGYRGEASLLCEREDDPEKCRQDSDILLLDMIEIHDWIPFSKAPPECSERCAVEYILGEDDKK